MKAMVLHEYGQPMVLEERPIPGPEDGEVLIRVRACGLGLTLVWKKTERASSSAGPSRLPRIIGHEVAGDVVSVGTAVSGLRPGDRVAVYYYLTCGDCSWCRRGREDLCDGPRGRVGEQIDGGLAEYMTLPGRNVCLIPDSLNYVDAAVATDAIATPLHVLRRRAALAPGETILVIGAGGGVGIHMVAMARALGARVIAADIGKAKLKAARDAGAVATIDASTVSIIDTVSEISSGYGVDVVVDMVGITETYEACVASVGKGGRVIFVGTYEPDAELTFKPRMLAGGEIILTGSRYCTYQELVDTLELVDAGYVRTFVTRTCDLEEADSVLASIERKELVGRAAVVFP